MAAARGLPSGRSEPEQPFVRLLGPVRLEGVEHVRGFGSDWKHFQYLARRGLAEPEVIVPDLPRALDLLRGTPFGNVPAGRYAWSSWLQREMVDVAHTLADVYLLRIEYRYGNLGAMAASLAVELDEETNALVGHPSTGIR